ncbi:hypothetical protein [Methanoregula sp.]|uniref:hypothetical protein n=1 Tax=Methanoregula sp. TaxID=2052170 RepID=UPI002614BC1D|nr:hypothetical protein [Methanoregula sp.]MDD5142028.1 hypothetical protein [Methanoregula sp.]
MHTHSAAFLKDQITLFEQSVSETARHLSAPSDPGSWHASAPFVGKCRIRSLMNSTSLLPEEKAFLVQEYTRIVEKLDALLDEHGQVYRDLLLAELGALVHVYLAETCHASLGSDHECARSAVSHRELIGELLEHLNSHYPLSALEALVATVDANAVGADKIVSGKGSEEDFTSQGLFSLCSPGKDVYHCCGTRPSADHP